MEGNKLSGEISEKWEPPEISNKLKCLAYPSISQIFRIFLISIRKMHKAY